MDLNSLMKRTKTETSIPLLDIELILAFILKKSREHILTHPETKLTNSQITNYQLLINRRLNGEPLAYITGHKEFYALDFKVNKNVLIPRPETELMVEEAMQIAQRASHSAHRTTIIDVGTGSGCIITTLAHLIKNYELRIMNYDLYGIDVSKEALAVAKQNAKKNTVNDIIKFIHGNLLIPFLNKSKIQNPKSKIIITANLPYLTPTQIKNSPTIKFEPKLALTAGADGLKYYRQLFKQIKILLNTTAAKSSRRDFAGAEKFYDSQYVMRDMRCAILCEIDPSQKNFIQQLIKKELPDANFEIKKDLRGHNRLVIIELNS
jgi:release factor glutamine methyltransferase